MSAIVRETSEYVEMSDSITLCIVKDGAAGSDAVTYGVQVTPTYETWSDAKNHAGIALMFTKTTGSTMLKYWNVQVLGTAKVYVDGTELEDLNKWVNGGNNKIIFDSFTFDGTNNTPTIGTASVISIELIVDDKIVATANYANGKQGADGKGALEISVAPDTLVFDTNDNGIVPSGTSKRATIACYRDGKKVTNVEYALTEGGHPDCSASISTSNSTATVTISKIATDEPYGVSKTCGTVEVQVWDKDNGRYYFPTVKFSVNVAKFNGGLKADNKRFETTYNYLTNNGTSTNFTYFESKIRQTAKEISLKVSEKRAGRRNLLPGSAFRKQGEGCEFKLGKGGYGIQAVGGYEGTNCVRALAQGDNYAGVYWWGNNGTNKNIKIKRNTRYTLSVWAKAASVSVLAIMCEAVYEKAETGFARDGRVSEVRYSYPTVKAGEWQQFMLTVQTDGSHDWMECNFWATTPDSSTAIDVLFCRPMLEEGDEYNGWTLSEQDYDYVGGNLLDNAGTLVRGGNLGTLRGTVTQNAFDGNSAVVNMVTHKLAGRVSTKTSLPTSASYGDYYACNDTWRIWKYTGTTLVDNEHYNGFTLVDSDEEMLHNDFLAFSLELGDYEDYVVSWYAKGDAEVGVFVEGSGQEVTVECSDGFSGDGMTYGERPMRLTSEWKRYWAHFRKTKGTVRTLCFRQYRNDDNTASRFYLSQPKLEVGATMTEWTAKRSDMVDKQALYATGIDIDSKKITLTADKTYVQSNSGEPIAMFSASDGFINSDILNVKHVYAKDANGTVYGHFGYEDATGGTSSSGKKYPLWLGAETCDRAPFAVSSSGDMYANSGMLGPFSIGGYGISSPSFSTGTGMSLGFLITLTGATFNSNNNNYDMAAVIGGHTAYGDPLSYLTGGGDYSDPTYRDFSTSFGYGTTRARQSLYVRKKLDGSSSPSTSVDIHGYNQASGKPYAAMIVDSDCMGVNSPSSNFFGGMACGLLRVSSVSGTNLAAWDENRVTTLVMTNSSRETVPLPKYPEVGQMIWVIQQGGIVYFSSDNSHPIKTANGTGSTVTSGANSNKKGQINLFVWDGQYWNCSYINGGLF